MSLKLSFDQGRIREYHYFMLLSLIQKRKRISRAELASITSMSNTSVGKIVKELIKDGLVIEVGQTEGHVGRKATLLEINPTGAFIIGVDIQVDVIQVAAVSLNGDVVEKEKFYFSEDQSPEIVLDMLTAKINKKVNKLQPEVSDRILAIGVSVPGIVTWPEGEIVTVPQLNWHNVKVKSYLEDKLKYVVYVDNDVRAVLLAESLFGSMANYQEAACIYIGSGIGGGVMVDNEILRGHSNTLGEIGHMTLNSEGPLCDCGRLGCLQTYICSSELQKQTGRSIEEIFVSLERQEKWACKLIERAKKYLSIAIANIVCIYNPEAILITGPMAEEFPTLTEGVPSQVGEYVWRPLKGSFQIEYSKIGADSGVVGASALVLHEYLRRSGNSVQ